MNTEIKETPEPQLGFSSLEETRAGTLEGITNSPPSPMPTPDSSSEKIVEMPDQFPKKQPVSGPVDVDLEKFAKYKDYKGNSFDPRIHKLKDDGTPELTREGKLKMLPPSKRGLVDSVKSMFQKPLSDHELSEKEEAAAKAQGEAAAKMDALEGSAEIGSEMYFAIGSTILSGGFMENKKVRKPKIKAALMEYERRTGKGFDLPPGLTLTLVLLGDVTEQCATNKDCGGRIAMVKGAVFRQAAKSSIKEKVGGWFSRKKKADHDQNAEQEGAE